MTRRSRRGIAGEGRPPRPGGALVPVTVRLPPETIARMDAARGDDTKSEWVRVAVEARLAGLPAVGSTEECEWSRSNRPAANFVDPVTGWVHWSGGTWDHPGGFGVASWSDCDGGLWLGRRYVKHTIPLLYPGAPQTLRDAVLYAHKHHGVPLAGRLAQTVRNPPREAPPQTREDSGDKGPGGD